MQFDYREMKSWPPLAWLARCPRSQQTVTVSHGSRVETRDCFFAEAVWPGEFEAGGFDETDIVAGSGGRSRGDRVVFVSAGATVDRLNVYEDDDTVWVSNSLACLVAAVGLSFDPTYEHYYEDFYSIASGIDAYRSRFKVSGGAVELVYFRNLRWDGRELAKIDKPNDGVDLSSFERYIGFMSGTMKALAANAAASARAHPYSLLATISTGYDSPTVAALAKRAGCREAICFDRSFRGEDDSGEAIASYLGITPNRIDGDAWMRYELPEVPFIAADSMGEEVRYRTAEHLLPGKVLLTGYHGDKIWDPNTSGAALGRTLKRGDPSGIALSEYRLWVGFVHCPVPFWGARQIAQVNELAKSAELQSWNVPGDYNRPICRRVVEESGVPRELFGMAKRNASVFMHNRDEFLTPSSQRDFARWLRSKRGAWVRRGRIPPIASMALDRALHTTGEAWCDWAKRQPVLWRSVGRIEGRPTYLRKYVFPWALEQAANRYKSGG